MSLTVVIGGGAAGVAAAKTLNDAGREVLLIEAGDRLGGRAKSVPLTLPASTVIPAQAGISSLTDDLHHHATPTFAGVTKGDQNVTVDLGCGWPHSARRNPWTAIAKAEGYAIDRSSPGWREQWRDLGFPAADQEAFATAWQHWETAARAALDGPDRSLSDFVAADDPWRPMLDAISGYANGAGLAAVSLHDWAAYEDAATDDNWALPAGCGTLIAGHARGVPHRLGTPVERIDHHGRTIKLTTPAGTIEADTVVVCVPTPALARIVFDPPLPAKHDAAAALPLGLADKVFIAVDRPDWPAHSHLIGNPRSACTASHRLSPFGWPIVESFFGGDCAEALEDERAASAFAVDELVALLGGDWRQRLHPLGATRWRHEPFIHGSYSHARIGHAAARQALTEPVDGRLFFAGEACSPSDFSTAHGAYQTGIDAARAVMALQPGEAAIG